MEFINNLSVEIKKMTSGHNKMENVLNDLNQAKTLERVKKVAKIKEIMETTDLIEWLYWLTTLFYPRRYTIQNSNVQF